MTVGCLLGQSVSQYTLVYCDVGARQGLYCNTVTVPTTQPSWALGARLGTLGAQAGAGAWALGGAGQQVRGRGQTRRRQARRGERSSGARGRQQRLAGRAGQAAAARRARAAVARLGAWSARGTGARRAGWPGLCTLCTRPVFGPVRLSIFPESNFWTLFVNPVHEHCSSQNFSKFFFIK